MIYIITPLCIFVYVLIGTIMAALLGRINSAEFGSSDSVGVLIAVWPLVGVIGLAYYYIFRNIYNSIRYGHPMQTWKSYVSRKSS